MKGQKVWKRLQVLLQPGSEEIGITDNPTYMINGVIQCLSTPFGWMVLTTCISSNAPCFHPSFWTQHWAQPRYLSRFPDIGTCYFISILALSLRVFSFCETFVFNGINWPMSISDFGYSIDNQPTNLFPHTCICHTWFSSILCSAVACDGRSFYQKARHGQFINFK